MLPARVVLWLVLLLSLAPVTRALEIRETLWGFDAHVVPGHFNLLSVRLANPTARVFDGAVRLRETTGAVTGRGAPQFQPLFLSPGAERWVQFLVFIEAGYERFSLSWDSGKSEALIEPSNGPPARVVLTDRRNAFLANSRVRAFDEALFPPSVAMTDGLDALALDAIPRWEAPRREALLAWVQRGGILLVLKGADGRFPTFTDQLAAFESGQTETRLGAGRIVRVPVSRAELTERHFEEITPRPRLESAKQATVYNFTQQVFQRLGRLTRPKISWPTISLFSALYLLLIGPAHYLVAKRLDYRLSLLIFLAGVAIFSGVFAIVGRRGYDEAQTTHSLSVARWLGGGRHDVTQWISAFVTRGDTYQFSHRATANYYATPGSEAIIGEIHNGRDGHYLVDIPLYSSRQFLHRAEMAGPDLTVTVQRWEESEGRLKALVLRTGPGFPGETRDLRVRFRGLFYRLERNGPDLILAASEQHEALDTFLPAARLQRALQQFGTQDEMTRPLFELAPALFVRALDGEGFVQNAIARGAQPAGELQLLVLAPRARQFPAPGRRFRPRRGHHPLRAGGLQTVSSSMSQPIIDIQHLSHRYRTHHALRDVSFTVGAQSIHGFVGPNGAGKTTSLKILATLLRPQAGSGRVTVFGTDIVRDRQQVRRKIGFMPDHFSMYRQMTVLEYLDFFGAAYGLAPAERERIIQDVLALTDMAGRKDDLINGLSRGMQQRVSLARVLVHDPDLLLLDEPASGLDPRARIELMEILEELRRLGKTIFISSHILSELATLCDHVTILDRGTVKYTGSMRGLMTGSEGTVVSYHLTLASEHPATAEALTRLPGVQRVLPSLPQQPRYTVTFDRAEVSLNSILETALAAGAQIESCAEDVKQLNQAFMDLTEPGVGK